MYFNNVKNIAELKNQYRKLALTLHPDRGGNAKEFATLQIEYERLLAELKNAKDNQAKQARYTYNGQATQAGNANKERAQSGQRRRQRNRNNYCQFKRKDNYTDALLKKANEYLKAGILIVPNKDCLKGYYNGLVLIDRLTDRSFNFTESKETISNLIRKVDDKYKPTLIDYSDNVKHQDYDTKISFFDKTKNDWFDILKYGIPKDKKRRTQQVIALNNMTFDDSRYSVCGFETTVSQNDVQIPGKKGNPKIDLVVINPSKKKMLLVEYKCKGASMLKGKQNIEINYKDYKKILDSDAICTIKAEMLKSYKLLCRIRGIKIKDEDFNPDDYEVQIAFLFVDRVHDKYCNIESEITFDDYKDAMKIFKQLPSDELGKVLYIRCETADEVILDNWKPIANSGLKKTIAVKS